MVRRGRLVWEDSLRSRQDHVPGMGPHRVGMGDTNSGGDTSSGGHCTTQRTSVKLELLNSDAVSRPIEKNARVIQLCFDVIKHIYIYYRTSFCHFAFSHFQSPKRPDVFFFRHPNGCQTARVWKANPSLRCFLDFYNHIQSGCQPAACLPIRTN